MRISRVHAGAILALALILSVAGGGRALADRKVSLGDIAITELADLGDRPELNVDGRPAKLGWLYREYSVLQAPFWVFDERGYVLFSTEGYDRTYVPISTREALALGQGVGLDLPESGSPLTVWDRWSGWIVFGVFAVIALIGKFRRRAR